MSLSLALDVTYKVGCNNPEVIEVTIDTYVGEEVIYENEAKNVTDTLGIGVHTLSFDMENGCTGSIIVTVT
jgi:hypothetical protein